MGIISAIKRKLTRESILTMKKSEIVQESLNLIETIPIDEFNRLKMEIFQVIITTFYKKKFGLIEKGSEFSVYDLAQTEADLKRFNYLNDSSWKLVIANLIAASEEISPLFGHYKSYSKQGNLKVALINLSTIKRACFRVLE